MPGATKEIPPSVLGRVVYIDDGDTLVILNQDRKQIRVRLTDADAPETPKDNQGKLGQPFSRASANNLARLAKGKNAAAHCYEYDAFDRPVCRVIVDGRDLSMEQIKAGLAWANAANRRYVRDPQAFEHEKAARGKGVGLWSGNRPIEPWLWRRACWKEKQCSGAGS
jgi:endonuclease YncB( thermonuclease family)